MIVRYCSTNIVVIFLLLLFVAGSSNSEETQQPVDTTLSVTQKTSSMGSADSLRKFTYDSLQIEYNKYVNMEKEGKKLRIKGGIIIGVVAPVALIASATVIALIDNNSGGKLLENASIVAIIPAFGVVGIGAGGVSMRMKGKRMVKKARYFKRQIEMQLNDIDDDSSKVISE